MYGYDCTAKAIPDTLNNTKRYTIRILYTMLHVHKWLKLFIFVRDKCYKF